MTQDEHVTYAGGAQQSADAESMRFDLVPPIATIKRAERFALGASRYGDNNWRCGMPLSSIVNHIERHWQLWRLGDRSDDHLAAVAARVDMLIECERCGWQTVTGETSCCGRNRTERHNTAYDSIEATTET